MSSIVRGMKLDAPGQSSPVCPPSSASFLAIHSTLSKSRAKYEFKTILGSGSLDQ